MKRVQLAIFDDIEFAAGGKLLEASKTVQLGWEGEWVELDLTHSNYASLRDVLAPYLKAGHKEGAIGSPRDEPAGSPRRRAYYKGLREWAKRAGRQQEYMRPESGTYTYPKPLCDDYDAYLLSQAGE